MPGPDGKSRRMAIQVPKPRRSPRREEGYGNDLAYVHDVGFGGFARDAAPWLLERLADRGIGGGHVVDLGCGSGIWAAALLAAGYTVTGYDQSAAMIRLARRHAPGGKFRVASFLDVALPSCAAVTALGEIFNYLFDATNSLQRLRELFARIHDVLEPGGMLIFDVATPGREPQGRRSAFRQADDWACLFEAVEDRQQRLLTRTITTYRKWGSAYRRHDEMHRLRLYEPKELLSLLRQAGFRARRVKRYGQCTFPRGYVGFVATKPRDP